MGFIIYFAISNTANQTTIYPEFFKKTAPMTKIKPL